MKNQDKDFTRELTIIQKKSKRKEKLSLQTGKIIFVHTFYKQRTKIMNIQTISNQQNIYINNNIKPNFRPAAAPKNAVNFGSSKGEAIIKLLDSSIDTLINGSELNIANKIKFHKVLSKALPEIMVPENYINKGRDSKVYRINDKYVAKIRRGYYANNSVRIYDTTTMPNKQFKQLDCYYGEPVAKVGKVEILRNATPNQNHIYCGAKYHGNGNVALREIEAYETKFLPVCNDVPQESFDSLASNLKKLNGMTKRTLKGTETYVPDIINPNNLLISNNKFALVDKLDTVPYENPNSIYTMLEPLILRLNPDTPVSEKDSLMGMRKNIFKKILIASEKNELPLDSPLKYPYSEWVLQNAVGDNGILSRLQKMRDAKAPLKDRLEEINKNFADMENV